MEYHNLNNQVVKESLEVESSSSFDPTQGLKKESPVKDSNKDSEKLSETTSSMSSGGATSTRKALKVEVEKQSGSSDTLSKSDFAKKPFKDESNKKLDASGEFAKAWKPLLTTEQIKDNRGMGAFSNSPSPSTSTSTPLPTFSNINVGVKSMITHLNKENTRWVFIPNSSPDIWTGAGYRTQSSNQTNGISLTSVLPSSNNNQQFNPTSMENQVTSGGGTQTKKTTYDALPNSISPTSDWSNALTFTNKNNPQRNQLLLRGLLGTIPVLINKSGGSGNEFNHTSEQQWDKTETNEGNLPGFGEVNGLYQLNKKLLAYFY